MPSSQKLGIPTQTPCENLLETPGQRGNPESRRTHMTGTTFTIVTECPHSPQEMFERSLDIDRHVDSMARSRERAIGGVTSGRIGDGETVTWRARHFRIWFTMTSGVSEVDPPRRFVDQQLRGPFRRFRHEHIFEEIPMGTRMIDTITVASPVFGRVAERLILVPHLRRLITERNRVLIAS